MHWFRTNNEIGIPTANLPKVAVTGETITNYPPSGCGSHLSQHQGMNNLEGMALLWCKRAKNDLQDCRIADIKNKALTRSASDQFGRNAPLV